MFTLIFSGLLPYHPPILCRRDQAVIEQPAGAARGRNLRDAILKKEQVLDDHDPDADEPPPP